MSIHALLRNGITAVTALILTGCQSLAYYSQAVNGQLNLLAKRKPIPQLISATDTPEPLREKLVQVQKIRHFAETELRLPAQKQYNTYVELGRPYPVWSVMATPELSLIPKVWRYWFVGKLSYRGFFKEERAREYAEQLKKEGFDVYLSGIPAYSTLGWFRDPVLSSFVHQGETELAELIFHELAHQLLFIAGDTVFNESFAVTVADEGLRRYNEIYPLQLEKLQQAKSRRQDFIKLVMTYRQRLAKAFANAQTLEQKKFEKDKVYAELKSAYEQQKAAWGGYTGYDLWFSDVNNAKLNTIATYYDYVPELKAVLARVNHDIEAFYNECKRLGRLSIAERNAQLLPNKSTQ